MQLTCCSPSTFMDCQKETFVYLYHDNITLFPFFLVINQDPKKDTQLLSSLLF